MLLCCQLSQDLWDTWREECQCRISLRVPGVFVQGFPRLGQRARSHLFWKLLVETRFTCCRPNFVHLPMGRRKSLSSPCSRPGSRLATDLLPELTLESLKSRNVVTLHPCLSSRRSLRCSTLKSAASCFLQSPVPVPALNAPHQKKVPCQVRPGSQAALLPGRIRYQPLQLHQPDT